LKVRADQLAVQQGLCASRALAQRLIDEAQVLLPDGTPVRKPGQQLDEITRLVLSAPPQYVSRGAGKLLAAIEAFQPELQGVTALDLGASTGGFTDVLLQHGAAKVFAVDVGHDQLHEKLRNDPRVISLEGLNARDLDATIIPEPIDILVADVSFISLTKVLPPCAPLLKSPAWAIVLVKPQFEAGKRDVGSGGVVRDEAVRQRCLDTIIAFAQNELHWTLVGTLPSPVLGPNGNQEFLAAFRNS
jgi:23S rRNA (cytidine1920-2'-O)/16S rRNA (cytidine1409-2'-O)-methyltransferase